MIKFNMVNVNPKKKRTGDCAVRALVGTLDIDYETAIDKCAYYAKKLCYGITDKQIMEAVLSEYGYVKMKQPRRENGTKYMVRDMDQILTKKQMNEGVLVTIANHHTCIKNGKIQDIWDCGNKCVGNYYIKDKRTA